MADVPRPKNEGENPDQKEELLSYRVHYAREMKIPGGGSVVFGEEARLQSRTRKDAERELKSFIKEKSGNPLLSGFCLMEIRYLKESA